VRKRVKPSGRDRRVDWVKPPVLVRSIRKQKNLEKKRTEGDPKKKQVRHGESKWSGRNAWLKETRGGARPKKTEVRLLNHPVGGGKKNRTEQKTGKEGGKECSRSWEKRGGGAETTKVEKKGVEGEKKWSKRNRWSLGGPWTVGGGGWNVVGENAFRGKGKKGPKSKRKQVPGLKRSEKGQARRTG